MRKITNILFFHIYHYLVLIYYFILPYYILPYNFELRQLNCFDCDVTVLFVLGSSNHDAGDGPQHYPANSHYNQQSSYLNSHQHYGTSMQGGTLQQQTACTSFFLTVYNIFTCD